MTTELSLDVTRFKHQGPDGYVDRCNYCHIEIEGKDKQELEKAIRTHFSVKHIGDLREHAKYLLNLADELEERKTAK